MKILKPKESLNKAYCRQAIKSADYQKFLTALRTLIANIHDGQDEEIQKGYFADFLKSAFYSNYIVGPAKYNIDLAIRLNNSPDSPLGVIVETKSTTNACQMVTCTDLNRKAMHQILFYYFNERERGNNDIKYLIISNLKEFFIFDAKVIEKIFYENKKFLQEYRDFNNKRKVKDNTEIFYDEIAPKYIREAADAIEFTHFDLADYKSDLKHNEYSRKLTKLYRLFSPIHLLKLPFGNDSNSLDKNFYNELLYILGLTEYKENNKTLIGRITDNPQPASLIENAINIIKAEATLPGYIKGDTENDRCFNAAMQLIITWINRILFLKLLESQLISYQKGDNKYRFLNYSLINDFDTLNKLFFQVLGVPVEERSDAVKEQFPQVPYLNSSLFEISRCEQDLIRISNLSQTECLPIFPRSILRKNKTYNSRHALPFLEYLFEFLDAYDFSSEGSDEIKEQSKTLINASVLGLIFEKINGYKDGSVFTPGFITSYMCREAITRTVVDKFNEHYDWQLATYDELLNKDLPSLQDANKIINAIHICDPAVGSGHFLVSALNEIVRVKYELGILIDANGKRLKKSEYTFTVENDELIILDCDGGLWSYNPANEESRRVQQTVFNEKKTIIENCLFGVDINPNSVNICRLRLWIELLKNAYYTPESNFTRLETLPNIDINIKCGNSLLSYFNLNGKLDFPHINEYKKLVKDYKSSLSKADKHTIEQKITLIKSKLHDTYTGKNPIIDEFQKARGYYQFLTQSALFDEDLSRKEKSILNRRIKSAQKAYVKAQATYDKYIQSHQVSGTFEWRIEFPEILDDKGNFEGFDLIIGNPPYFVYQDNHVGEIKQLRNITEYDIAFGGKLNAYKLFLANGLRKLLKPKGILSFIFQNSFLGDLQAANLRKFVLNENTILKIDSFPERDNRKKRVFEGVKMSVCIVLLRKTPALPTYHFPVNIWDDKDKSSGIQTSFSFEEISSIDRDSMIIPRLRKNEIPTVIKLIKHRQLELNCIEGELNMTLHKSYFVDDNTRPAILKGAAIQKFNYTFNMSQGEIEYLNETKYLNDFGTSPKSTHHFLNRIAMQGMTGANDKTRLIMCVIPSGYYLANSCNYILPTEEINLYALLAILNSSVLNWFFRCFSTNSNVNGYEVNNLPVPLVDIKTQNTLAELSLKAGDSSNNINYLRQIDLITYHLYNLTYDEVLIIDPETTISLEEYETFRFNLQVNA